MPLEALQSVDTPCSARSVQKFCGSTPHGETEPHGRTSPRHAAPAGRTSRGTAPATQLQRSNHDRWLQRRLLALRNEQPQQRRMTRTGTGFQTADRTSASSGSPTQPSQSVVERQMAGRVSQRGVPIRFPHERATDQQRFAPPSCLNDAMRAHGPPAVPCRAQGLRPLRATRRGHRRPPCGQPAPSEKPPQSRLPGAALSKVPTPARPLRRQRCSVIVAGALRPPTRDPKGAPRPSIHDNGTPQYAAAPRQLRTPQHTGPRSDPRLPLPRWRLDSGPSG